MRLTRAMVALLGLTACSTAPSAEPTATSAPMTSPAAELVDVAVDELAIGNPPAEIGADAVQISPATLTGGSRAWVLASVGEWVLVAAETPPGSEQAMLIGWAPAEVDGGPAFGPVDLECPPPQLTVPQLAGLGWLGGLACYGGGGVELIGFTPIGCGIGGSPTVGTPDWLNGTFTGIGIGASEPRPPDYEVETAVIGRSGPGAQIPQCGEPGWYRFRGHFDDPAAATCRTETSDGAGVIVEEPLVSELHCRAQLVLESRVLLPGHP